jgi:hypothetical protein
VKTRAARGWRRRNGAFLRAGHDDELSLVIRPTVDGAPTRPVLATLGNRLGSAGNDHKRSGIISISLDFLESNKNH